MSLPTDLDYQEAIQNPRSVFADQELQDGQPELISPALPLPKPRTGNFAVAFRMNCGQKSWAVKCFTRALHPDLQSRYMEISKHLDSTGSPYAVGFTFLPHGIRVHSHWYPILKMAWLDGELLSKYIERNITNHAALVSLATKWIEMLRALQGAGIAHGDLQHGNVVVVGGCLRLIDYDGMFVPGLTGRPSHEKGHQNYQHPQRGAEFGPGLDNFSAWVIFVSILAVAYEPKLWARFNGGDECLLFRKSDFTDPDKSKVIQSLLGSKEQRLQALGSLFRNITYMAPEQVPSLDGQFVASVPLEAAPRAIPDWIGDHLGNVASQSRASATQVPAARSDGIELDMSAWMLEFIESSPSERAIFSSPPDRERVAAALSMMVVGLIGFGVANGNAPTLLLACFPGILLANVVFWLIRYRQDEAVQQRGERLRRLAEVENEIAQSDARIRNLDSERRRFEAASLEEVETFRKKYEAVAKRQAVEIESPRRDYRVESDRLKTERAATDQRETSRLRQVQNDSGAKLAALNQQIATSIQAESAELAKALIVLQQEFVDAALRTATIDRADIPGVKDALKANLRANGIYSAADAQRINYVKVTGIGDKKRFGILAWRHSVETQARTRMPTTLPWGVASAIQSAHQGHRRVLESDRDRTQQRNSDDRRAAQAQATVEREALLTQEGIAKNQLDRAEAAIVARYAHEFTRATEEAAAATAVAKVRSDDFERRVQEMRKATFGIKWRRERVRREAAAFERVRFRRYLRRIVPGMGE